MSALSLDYEVRGEGGSSQPQGLSTPLDNHKFWWIDNTGSVPGAEADRLGFPPLREGTTPVKLIPLGNGIGNAPFLGSLLISTPFTLAGNETLHVDASIVTGLRGSRLYPAFAFGFGLLLSGGRTCAVLFASRADGVKNLNDIGPTLLLPEPSSEVTAVEVTKQLPLQTDVTLGTNSFGKLVDPSHCGFGYTQETVSVAPGAGEYQILLGAFCADNGAGGFETAVAITSAAVVSHAAAHR